MFHAKLLRQDWDKALPKYWNDDSAFKSHFLNALSITLPDCERFFIGTITPYLRQINDDDLAAQTKEFVKQESHHRHAHNHYNDWLEAQGLPVSELQASANRKWDWVIRHLSDEQKLAITICIEHITVVYASVFLSYPEILNRMHPHFRDIWRWHAVEEIEHKAVTMDVWNRFHGSPRLKWMAMAITLPVYMWYVGKNTLIFLHRDHRLWEWSTWKDMIQFLFNKQDGVVRRSFRMWMDMLRKDFHPNDHDHTDLLKIEKFSK